MSDERLADGDYLTMENARIDLRTELTRLDCLHFKMPPILATAYGLELRKGIEVLDRTKWKEVRPWALILGCTGLEDFRKGTVEQDAERIASGIARLAVGAILQGHLYR